MSDILDPDTWRYELNVMTQDGTRLHMPFGGLVWTENADNLAAEVRCTIPNERFEVEGTTIYPWDALGCGTPIYLSVVPRGGTSTARAQVASSGLLGMPWDPGLLGASELGAGVEVFQGTVLEVKASTGSPLALEVMARDPLHYLLLNDIDFRIDEGTSFKAALQQLADTWGIEVGRVDGPDVELGEYSTGNEIKDAGTVLSELLAMANAAGAGLFLVRATAGKLEVVAPGKNTPIYELRPGGSAGSSSVSVSIADLVEEVEVFAEDQAPPPPPDDPDAEDVAPPAKRKGTSGKVLPLRRMAGASSHAGFSGARKRVKVQGVSYYRGSTTIDMPAVGGASSAGSGGGATNGSQVSDRERWTIATQGGFSPEEAVTAAAISLLECPNCEFSSVNATGDMGLFQINKQHWDRYGGQGAMADPINNAKAAYGIYSGSGGGERGWRNWCTYPGGCNGASPTTPAQFQQLTNRIQAALSGIYDTPGGSGSTGAGGSAKAIGPSQEHADMEAAVALGEEAFPQWRWDHTTVDLPQVRKYDALAIHDALIDGQMVVMGVAHEPSSGTMRLTLLDQETFDRRAKTMSLNVQLAKLRGDEQELRQQTREASQGKAQGSTNPMIAGRVWPLAGDSSNDPRASYHARAAGGPGGGSDLMAERGMPVFAMKGGTVAWTSSGQGPGGNCIQIDGDDGLSYYYAHFDAPSPVKQGEKVTTGQRIGSVGDTGNAKGTGPHLHLGIGHGISNGTGPSGGMGLNYPEAEDVLAELRPNPNRK